MRSLQVTKVSLLGGAMTAAAPAWMTDPELGDHICQPFDTTNEQLRATTRFVGAALERNRQVIVFTQTCTPSAMHAWLDDRVPGYAAAKARGQADIRPCEHVHLAGGRFDPERTMAGFGSAVEAAESAGYAGVLVVVDMAWALRQVPGTERLLQYEAAANPVFADRRMAAVCQYDTGLFDSATLAGACAAHPLTPGQSELRFSRSAEQRGLHLAGQVDDTNRAAFAALVEALAGVPGDVTIDAREIDAIDVAAVCLIAQCAAARPKHRTEILASDAVARPLRLISADLLTPLTIHAPDQAGSQPAVPQPQEPGRIG
jgi:hypothetical protein